MDKNPRRVSVEFHAPHLNELLQTLTIKPNAPMYKTLQGHTLAQLTCAFLYRRIIAQIAFESGKKKIKLSLPEAVAMVEILELCGDYEKVLAQKIRRALHNLEIDF